SVREERARSFQVFFRAQNSKIYGRKKRVREHSVVNLKEHTPINIVAPEDAAALAPEMLFKIARGQSVIDDAINREPRCHQGRLDAILQISGIGSIAHDYETLAVRKSGCAQCNARVAMTIEFPIWRQIIA